MFRTTTLRRLAPVALLAASALVLAACGSDSKDKTSSTAKSSSSPSSSSSPTKDANGCSTFSSGATSDSVKVSGAFGQKQTATFTTPLKASGLERTVLDKGKGATTKSGETLDVLISVYLGKDGKALGSQPVSLTVGDAQMIQAFTAGIDCVPIGSRVVVSAPAKDMYGEQGNSQLGITASDSLVIVTDVIGEKKQLVPQEWKQGAPTVTFGADGTPTLKLPDSKPPADLLLKVLKPGTGDVVKAGDTVTLDYQGTNWRTGKIFDQSYGKQPASFATTDVVEGFGAALVGQKVGARLVVSIPPKYGYGTAGSAQAGIKGTDTLVFVIEIKATKTG
ncbi:FKBP-type peptidyl-prolyl cis-trans isomerase [Marmoricola sp. URHA0025 HA25]